MARRAKRDWTIMLYSIADDKYLRAAVNSALTQIADVPVSAKVKTVAQVTLASYIKNPVRRFDFERHEIVGRPRDRKNHLQFDSPKNVGTAENLTAFLVWARRKYPADKYCIILQGHASGADFNGAVFGAQC